MLDLSRKRAGLGQDQGVGMSVSALPTSVTRVDDQTGALVRQRRMAMGLSVKALAEHAGVDRGRLTVLEDGGNVRMTTVTAVLHALDEFEHEMGMDVPSVVVAPEPPAAPGIIRFKVEGVYGARALVVEGPVENVAELEAAVDRILRRLAGDGIATDQP